MAWLAEEGTFKARVIQVGMAPESKPAEDGSISKSIGVNFLFEIVSKYVDGEWSEEWPCGYETKGTKYLAGKDGKPIPEAVRCLAEGMGWNGDPEQFKEITDWSGAILQITVKKETYQKKGQTTFETIYKAAWIDKVGAPIRGGIKVCDDTRLAQLKAEHGKDFKNLIKSAGITPTPPPPRPAPAPASDGLDYNEAATAVAAEADDFAF